MSNIICEVAVVPLGTAGTSLSDYVGAVEAVLRKHPAVKSLPTPMSTILEGEWANVFAAIRDMHEAPFLKGAQRVSTRIVVDDRRDKTATMEGKLASLMAKL